MNDLFKGVKNIIFDFDGVIIDSMDVRANGVREIFSKYDKEVVENFVEYYRYNAGLSKFHKIKYFYNNILNKDISEYEVNRYSENLTKIMKNKLISTDIIIKDTYEFIKKNYTNFNLHIASGSEENELQFLCNKLNIDKYFKSIKGAPIHKNDLVNNIIKENNYIRKETVIIGDSINDFDAAEINKIGFLGYNNLELKDKGIGYIYKYN